MTTTTVLTATGRAIVTGLLRAVGTEPKTVGWGTNPASLTAAATDVAPFTEAPEARVTGTSSQATTTTTNDTYQVTGTITASSGRTIGEVFLADSATKPTAVDAVQAASAIIGSNSATTLIVVSGAAFSVNQYIQIRTEVLKITGIASNTLTVTRAQNGSSAISTIALSDVVTGGNIPGGSAVTNGNLALHSSFTGLALDSGNSIAFTIGVVFA